MIFVNVLNEFFQQLSLTKNPKKRPTAEKLLLHPFVSPQLPRSLPIELLQKCSSPHLTYPPELEVNINILPETGSSIR